jgi:hypothetical protein
MADYVVKGESLTAVADAIREKTGATDALGLGEMPGKVGDVFEAGKKSEYDAFWDAFQSNGAQKFYSCSFGGEGWTDETYNPKYPIISDTGFATFRSNKITDTKVSIKFVGNTTLNATFYTCSNLRIIRELVLEEGVKFQGVFNGCANLEELYVKGTIGQTGFSVSACPLLTHDSLMSIINALKDYAGSGTTYTCTLGTANLAKLNDAEKQIATQKGWTLA